MPHEDSLSAQTSHRHPDAFATVHSFARIGCFVEISLLPQESVLCSSFDASCTSKNKPVKMAIKKVVLFALICIACSQASPIGRTDEGLRPILVLPIFYVEEIRNVKTAPLEETTVESESDEIITTPLEEIGPGSVEVEKRSAEEESSSLEDLETAAGTNVLRPLFVYRQQVAYRQRIKDALRRGNRF